MFHKLSSLLLITCLLVVPIYAQTPIRANRQIVKTNTSTSYPIVTGDVGKLLTFNNSSPVAVSIPRAIAPSFPTDWFVDVKNLGVGSVTITPTTSTIGGAGTLVLTTGQSARVISNGTNYLVTATGSSTGGAGSWGTITGTLSAQTDLQSALDAKVTLTTNQSVTGAKTFTDGTLLMLGGDYGATDGSMPTGVEKGFFLNTNASSRKFFIYNNAGYHELLQAGISATMHPIDFRAAGCVNATAASFWDLPVTTPAVAACVTGTNIQKGVLDFADSGPFIAQTSFSLPANWTSTGGIDASIYWTTTATTGDAKWNIYTACTAVNGTATDDPSWNTAQTITTTTAGTTNRINTSTQTALTLTGCTTATAMQMHIKIMRDGTSGGDSIAATARLISVQITYRRSQ